MSKHFLFLSGARRKVDSRNWGTKIKFTAMILFLVISLIGMNYSVVSAAGTTYYVDNTVTCSDSGSGTTTGSPFCTLARGAFKAVAGDTVRVLHGTYAETVYPSTGTAGQPVTFQANPGVTVTGNSAGFGSAFAISTKSYIVIDGFNITETKYFGIYVTASNHITITNNHISYAGDPSTTDAHRRGIYLSGTTDSIVTGNTTDHNTCVGIMLINGSDRNIVSNNISFANASTVVADAAGISVIGGSYNTITNNLVYGNEDSGISVYDYNELLASSYNLIAGNVIYGNGDHGIDNNDSPYNTIVGNTIHGNGTVGLNFEGSWVGSHHAVVANNILAANGITPNSTAYGGNLRVDPLSIDGTTIDYDLFDKAGAGSQIIWNSNYYGSLQAFHAAEPGQESHGVEGDPHFVAPVQPVLRNDDRPYFITATFGDYHLSAGSPAIDSANADAPSQPAADFEGKPRIDDLATPDTGAGVRTYDDRGGYEFQPFGSTPTTTAINCGTATVTYRSSLSCTVTVTRGSGSGTPTGSVNWTTDQSGIFSTSPCTLAGSGSAATCSVSYVPRAVGAGSHLITANYAGDVNFQPSTTSQNITVNTRAVVPAITASSKPYDGGTAATLLTQTLTGVVGGDIVSLAGGTANFDNKYIGTGKTVTAGSFSLAGLNAANYYLSPSTATTTANITARDLTVSATGVNKAYDGTTAATVNLSTDAVAGEVVTAAYTLASFADANAGNGKSISISGISISGPDTGNYHLLNTSATTTANITARDLTVSATGVNKAYDGTTVATVNLSTAPLAGEVVTAAYTLASFADANVGNGKSISISGISLSGPGAGNYHLLNTTASASANITKALLTVTADNKTISKGQPDPVFSFGYSGLANGETGAVIDTPPVCGVSVPHTNTGVYPIVCSGGSDNNYDFNYVNGTLAVGLNGADTTGVFRPSNGLLYLKNQNTTGFADIAINYGIGGDYPVVGDWDGDGDATIGVYRNGQFMLRNSNTLGFADMVFPFGMPGDQPVAGDWDGDGVDTIGIYRPWTGQFQLRNSNDAGEADMSFYLGNVGDVGIAGDWDGDGKDTTGVFRPTNGIIFLKNTNETGFAEVALNYGIPGDKPVTGDWDNNGVDTIGVLRGNVFYLRNSNTIGFADIEFALGLPGDMPIAGNWDALP